jgi:hypothetical protein
VAFAFLFRPAETAYAVCAALDCILRATQAKYVAFAFLSRAAQTTYVVCAALDCKIRAAQAKCVAFVFSPDPQFVEMPTDIET